MLDIITGFLFLFFTFLPVGCDSTKYGTVPWVSIFMQGNVHYALCTKSSCVYILYVFLHSTVCPDQMPGLQPWTPGFSESHRVTIGYGRKLLLTSSATVHSIEILNGGISTFYCLPSSITKSITGGFKVCLKGSCASLEWEIHSHLSCQ